MSPEAHLVIEKVIEESDNPLEIFFAVFLVALVDLIFKVVEVVLDLGYSNEVVSS